MHRDCQDCGNTYYAGDYNGGTIVEGCPKCGSYRTQPNPIHSEMETRDMPGPAASGLEDQGGNPLKEGILADGGWNNRMKRDESFASVKKTAAEIPAATFQAGLHNDPKGGLSRLAFKSRKMGPIILQGTVTPREESGVAPFEANGPYHDHANGCTTTANPAGLLSGECVDSCLHQQIPSYSHFQGIVSHPSDRFANLAAEMIKTESMNPLRKFEAERKAEKDQQVPLQPQAHTASEDDGWDDDEDENPYNPNAHDIADRFIVTPDGKVLRGGEGSYQNGAPTHEAVAVENGMHNGEFAQGHSLGVVHPDRSISFVQHQTPFSQEQLQQMIEPHFPGHTVNPVEQVSNEERWGLDQEPDADARNRSDESKQQEQLAVEQRGGKPFGHYDNPYVNRGGSTRDLFYTPLFRDSASIDADFDVEQIIPPGHHTVEVSVDGEKNPVILQHDNSEALDAAKTKLEARSAGIIGSLIGGGIGSAIGTALAPETGGLSLALPLVGRMVGSAIGRGGSGGQSQAPQQPQAPTSPPLDTLSSFHESLTTDLSNPGFDNTDDPEDVDQKEKNDGDNKDWQKDPNDTGGSDHGPDIPLDSDVGKAFQEALPSLIKYFDSDESGAHDPAIAHLVELIEAEHPGLLDGDHEIDDEDLADIHAAKGHTAAAPVVPGVGQAPGATPMGTPPANPMANSIPCPHCGALGAGAGNCAQCGMPLQAAPNVQPGIQPQPAPQTGPPQAQPVLAANQGPHNPEQFKAVADYLQQTSPPDQVAGILQDLINNPQNYGDVLAQIQNKGTTPQPDPDPGAPPPQPPMQDPNAQAPPGMMPPPQAKVAAPHPHDHGNTFGVPAADQQGQRDVSHEEDSSGYWKTSDGAPLQVGAEYEMYSNQYDIPDIIRVTAVKPESIEYILTGEYGLEHGTELTRTEAEMDGTTFQPAQDGDGPSDDETQGDVPHQAPHAFAKVKEAADSIAPKCPKCGSHTTETLNSDVDPGNFACHNCGNTWKRDVVPVKSGAAHPSVIPGALYPEEERLQSENYPHDGEVVQCPHCGSPTQASLGGCPHCLRTFPNRTAGAKFTPMEQREFIDEPGVARNMDKLDLSHTHYESANLTSDDFLFGL